MTGPGEIAVLDVGKTHVKIVVTDHAGQVVDSRQTENGVRPGPPWAHHDLAALAPWLAGTLAELCRLHPVTDVMPVGHGAGAVLVAADPDAADGTGCALPMMDYEAPCPAEIDAIYRTEAGPFRERGSAIMMASTHSARQLLRMQTERPRAVAGAAGFLQIAQYWAWWLSGVMASEHTMLGAQSHLRDVPRGCWTDIVTRHGWDRLMPPFRSAWEVLGTVRAGLVRRCGLPPELRIHTGAHDSSAHFYRYRAAGLERFTLVSTGTWIVALSAEADVGTFAEDRGLSVNADIDGAPVGGALSMGGRAFAAIAGRGWRGQLADPAAVARLIERGTFALPSYSADAGQVPGSAGRGRIVGPAPQDQAERTALAVVHAALLTVTCAGALTPDQRLILDGTFLAEPLYARLVAGFAGGREVRTAPASGGVAAGAALLVDHADRTTPVPLDLVAAAEPPEGPDYAAYAEEWRSRAATGERYE